MTTETTPCLRLFLDHAAKNSDRGGPITSWAPADSLTGHLELSGAEFMAIEDISMYFEGVARNWITECAEYERDPRVNKAEHKFLTQAQNIVPTTVSQRALSPERFIYEVPFHFVIPKAIARLDSEVPEHCMQLPPSLELGESITDESTGHIFAQPSISYYLRADITLNTGSGGSSMTIDTSLPVIVTPYTKEFPPTETMDFPAEFKEKESKELRRHLMSRGLGMMTVSVREPPALSYDIQSVHASTEVSVMLDFKSEGSSQIYQILQSLNFEVSPLLRIKTFYSLQSFPSLPSRSLLSLKGVMRMRDEIIKLDRKSIRGVSWKCAFQLIETPPRSASLPGGRWITHLSIPITVDTRLLPTFCTSVVARLYTTILRIKVVGARVESFNLEVPLQVVHRFPDQHQFMQTDPIRDEQRFLAFRRDSESSWLSDEALRILPE
ncbi:hypothetical protein OIDMADRAFT_148793 [Oidiodendron maius Zn]|uniref:Arrestin-like N-terminal domain-containing protein n=1 Tax=Oidiodendron maius (strain Zn) TaxID=913774 RepID=A0A0C3CA15_OIDMZ|nr:hypothetical protein OIDMADRAFT_148793 [Oidiodendron maius Zn]